MSTGFDHSGKGHINFETINSGVAAFDLEMFHGAAAIPQSKSERLATIYGVARPILLGVTALPLIPMTWRAVLRALIVSADEVTATFKAGKDLSADDGSGGKATPTVAQEPKLPVG
jgi:hypothetical protein